MARARSSRRRGRGPERRVPRGRWLGLAFLLLLALSLGLRYGPRWSRDLNQGLGRLRRALPVENETAPPSVARRQEAEAAGPAIPLRLQIYNATGVNRLAMDRGEGLRHWGVDALDRDNAPDWPFPETLLLVRSGKAGRLALVRELARRLGGVPVLLQRRDDLMLDATLVLGQDWEDYRWPEP